MSQKKLPKNIQQMIRVNQAGEFGAKRIYEGMIDYASPSEKPVLEHMLAQEKEHLREFNQLMIEHKVRPTFLQPLWYMGGYLMGAVTARIDPKIAHACTIAVEDVIEKHYQEQLDVLQTVDDSRFEHLKNTIARFRAEELEHHETATHQGGNEHPLSKPVHKLVRKITKCAIFLSKRI